MKLVRATTWTAGWGLDLGDRADPVELRHDDVHEDDVGLEPVHDLDGLDAVLGLTDHLDVVEQLEISAQPAPDDAMVVDEHDADGPGLGHGCSLVRVSAGAGAVRHHRSTPPDGAGAFRRVEPG